MEPANNIKKVFGTVIRSRRIRLGLSQEALAELANLHRTYVTDIESGTRNLTLESIEKLARALNATIAELFTLDVPSGAGAETAGAVDILMVEDGEQDIELTLEAFKQAKLTNRVEVIRDGAKALDFLLCRGEYRHRLMEPPPQAVLLDLNLPKVQGLEVLRQMKAEKLTRDIKVVVLTASRRDEDIREAMRLGASGYIVKPVDFQNFSQVTPKLDFWWTLLRPNLNPESINGNARAAG